MIPRYDLTSLAYMAYSLAASKGFWDDEPNLGEKIALIHSELSEALEEVRAGHAPDEVYWVDGKPEGLPIELADAVIRIADLCGHYGIDLNAVVHQKLLYNQTRPTKHGKQF